MIWANRFAGKSPSFNGRRQPSCGDTSRMMREYQVRICEGLGVKLPGPTRQKGTPGDQALMTAVYDYTRPCLSTLSDENERRPIGWMRAVTSFPDLAQHRTAKGLCASDRCVPLQFGECAGH